MLSPEPFRHQHLNLMIEQVLTSVAEQFLDLRIDQNNLPLSIHHHHGIGSGFQQPAELGFGSFALADIANGAPYQQSFLCLQGTETDLYGKLVPISVQAVHFTPFSHRAPPGLTEESGAIPRFLPPEPFRHQYLNFTIQYVFTPITEQLLD